VTLDLGCLSRSSIPSDLLCRDAGWACKLVIGLDLPFLRVYGKARSRGVGLEGGCQNWT
jgi:hypothetical protein